MQANGKKNINKLYIGYKNHSGRKPALRFFKNKFIIVEATADKIKST